MKQRKTKRDKMEHRRIYVQKEGEEKRKKDGKGKGKKKDKNSKIKPRNNRVRNAFF
jgi:hypothetical protein